MTALVLSLFACITTTTKDVTDTSDTADTAADTGSDTSDSGADTTDTTDTAETGDTAVDTGDTGTDTGADTSDSGTDTGNGGSDLDGLVAGDLVISEIMKNPHGLAVDGSSADISDLTGEWFEIFNASGADLNLRGLELADLDATDPDAHTISQDVFVEAGAYIVLGNSTDMTANGQVPVAYAWAADGFSLGNNTDEIVLRVGGVVIDQVVYTPTDFPDYKGYAMELSVLDAVANDTGSNWCEATSAYGPVIAFPGTGYRGVDRQYGTPGAANDPCAMTR
jgi:hypothetical protein